MAASSAVGNRQTGSGNVRSIPRVIRCTLAVVASRVRLSQLLAIAAVATSVFGGVAFPRAFVLAARGEGFFVVLVAGWLVAPAGALWVSATAKRGGSIKVWWAAFVLVVVGYALVALMTVVIIGLRSAIRSEGWIT